ncbi:MAG: radical SAM protein [Deltaproteobacteria bacterium]|nr:radical SAM protein [Deltaproteobacteria bacterium]
MRYVFGPVPSRRLGLSLGVDLVKPKTCSYDCLYCQVGRTTVKTIDTDQYVPLKDVLDELGTAVKKTRPDTITLSGSGEPTLYSQIDKVIEHIKKLTATKVAVLTNGSLLWKDEVRERLLAADIIIPTFSTVFEDTYRKIHRPHHELVLSTVIEGVKKLRKSYHGLLWLEVVLLKGVNDAEHEITGLKKIIDEISPEKIQLNTVVRPPSDPSARPLDREHMDRIKEIFGNKAEIITGRQLRQEGGEYESYIAAILEMARRRPVSAVDISSVINLPLEDVESLLKGLLIKGRIKSIEHSGNVFYALK